MNLSQKGLAELEHFEGCILHSYRDSVGIWTEGIGSTEHKDHTPVHQGEVLTQAQADDLVKWDLVSREAYMNNVIKAKLTQDQYDALVCLCYNIGVHGFGSSSVLKSINADPSIKNQANIIHNWKKWDEAGGHVEAALLERRERELVIYYSKQLSLQTIINIK